MEDPERREGPGAGAPDDEGGEFRPKDDTPGVDTLHAREIAGRAMRRRIVRRAFRAGLQRILTAKRLLRLGAEAGSNLVPGLDVVGDIALAADLTSAVQAFETPSREADAAYAFVEKGPQSLAALRASAADESFANYGAFLKEEQAKRFGPAGTGWQWHHIVEQTPGGATIPQKLLQSTKNVIRIPTLLHEEISAEYGKPYSGNPGQAVREHLRGKSFEEQYAEGLEILRRLGIVKED